MFYFGFANLRKIARKFLSEFFGKCCPQNFRPCFSRASGPKISTPKIYAQNCQHSSNPQIFENYRFTSRFCLWGRQLKSLGGGESRPTFWNSPPMICSTPLFGDALLLFPLEEMGTDQTNPISEASKSGFGGRIL